MKNYNWLRWVAFLPGALLGVIVVTLISKFIIEFWVGDWWGIHWLQVVGFYFIWSIQSFVAPIAFVIIGMRIAPNHKREVGFCLCAVLATYTIGMIVLNFLLINPNYQGFSKKSIVNLVFQSVGIVIAFGLMPKNDNDFNDSWEKTK